MASPVSDLVPAEEQVRKANDITKQHLDEYPGRFLGFASLPMADPKAAAAELERCVKEFGFCGPFPGNDHHPNVTFRLALYVK